MSLLRQFSQGQMRVGRERSSAMQDFHTHWQESLVSTTDSLLTASLPPLLTVLSGHLALQSSLPCLAIGYFGLATSFAPMFLFFLQLQLQSYSEFVSEFVSE
jgi:hypothetical protein